LRGANQNFTHTRRIADDKGDTKITAEEIVKNYLETKWF